MAAAAAARAEVLALRELSGRVPGEMGLSPDPAKRATQLQNLRKGWQLNADRLQEPAAPTPAPDPDPEPEPAPRAALEVLPYEPDPEPEPAAPPPAPRQRRRPRSRHPDPPAPQPEPEPERERGGNPLGDFLGGFFG